jgi:ribosomal protein S18 acetylase RimI-like enzyme
MKPKLINIRPVERTDLAAVQAIEATSCPRPWGEKDFVDFVAVERARMYVLEADRVVVGYLCFDATDKDEAVLARLTVVNTHRRTGLGTLLLERATELARKARAKQLVAHGYEQDQPLQFFLKAKGFQSAVVRRHFDKDTDAVRFWSQIRA